MHDEESQQASIPKDYGTISASADAGGSARRVVILALAAITLFASGVAVGSSIATTPRGASAYGLSMDEDGWLVGEGPPPVDGINQWSYAHPIDPLSPPTKKGHPSHPPLDGVNQWSDLGNGQITESDPKFHRHFLDN